MLYVQQIFHTRLTIIMMPVSSKLKPKFFLSSTISLCMRPASKPNHVAEISLSKQVTSAKNDSAPNITATIKDLNQPNYSVILPPPNQMTRSISNSCNNIPLYINMIDVNSNIFYLLSHTKKYLVLLISKILILTKIKIQRYLVPL